MEIYLACHFSSRMSVIVPNISWGFGVHECDIFMISTTGYATEIEIKVSLQDLKNDMKKSHKHISAKIKYLYFAIPKNLIVHIKYIPERAGIIIVSNHGICTTIKRAKANNSYKLSLRERYNIARLGTMRIWSMKAKIQDLGERVI